MNDLARTIAPKSDQLNADDMIAGPMTITVSGVTVADRMKEGEQPVSIRFEGDNGKPYKPCKSMRRVLVAVWGKDGTAYAGRRMTLYRDDKVQFGGMAVGGIRISHMSGIREDFTMPLTTTRGTRRPFTVRPLRDEAPRERKSEPPREQQVDRQDPPSDDSGARASAPARQGPTLFSIAREKARAGRDTFDAWRAQLKPHQDERLADIWEELRDLMQPASETSDLDEDVPA